MIDFERAELIKRPRQYRSQLKAKNNQQPSEERDMSEELVDCCGEGKQEFTDEVRECRAIFAR